MTTVREVQTLENPRADQMRFCPYHGAAILLADCPVVATNYEFNARNNATQLDPRQIGLSSASNSRGTVSSELEEDTDGPSPAPPPSTATTERPREKPSVRLRADVDVQVGKLVRSKVDGWERLVVARSPHYVPRRLRSAPELEAPALMAHEYGGAVVRPARACPTCLHPLPATIDYRDTYPMVLVGHKGSSKTSTVLAIIEEAGQNAPETFGVSNFSATEATTDYLLSIDKRIFAKFRKNENLDRTQENRIHPPLEFLTTIGVGGPPASLLLHDIAGEVLRNRDKRLEDAPSVLWADAIMFIYNPENSPALNSEEQPDQAYILNGLRDDLEARGPYDASGRPYEDPPLIFILSKADILPNCPDLSRDYTDEDVHSALRSLGDQAVINAANRFPVVHWLLMAPMPAQGGGPLGVGDVLSLLLRQLR
jgi:hypothetical protein